MIEKWLKIGILISSLVLPLTLAFFIYDTYQTTASCLDALSHLYIAKNVIDNGVNSGIKNLGTVWLPLYHISLIPFIFSNQLYFTGFAGTILGSILLFFTVFLILSFLPFPENIFASLLFILHPYLLIATVTPMTEILAIFLLLFTTYHLHQFLKDGRGMRRLGIGVVLGTLTRYEFYPIPFLILPFLILRKKGNWRKIIPIALFLFSGIFFWLIWNQLLFADPLFFFRHPVVKDTAGNLIYAQSLRKVVYFNLSILKELFGILPFFSLLGIAFLSIKRKFHLLLPLLLLITPFFTHLFLAYQNISLGYARFFLLSFAGILLSSFLFCREITNLALLKKFKVIRFLPLIIFILYLPTLKENYSVLKVGKNHYQHKINLPDLDVNYQKVNYYLKTFRNLFSNMDLTSAHLLIPFNQECQTISFALRLTPEQLFDPFDGEFILKVMEKPWEFCDYLLLTDTLTPFCPIFQKYYQGKYFLFLFWQDEEYQKTILNHFSLVKKENGLRLYQKVR